MNIFLSSDRATYRRWINILPSLILPGSSHYLSGHRAAGLAWFVGFLAYTTMNFFITYSPSQIPSSIKALSQGINVIFLVSLCADACRRVLPRIGFARWLALFGLATAIVLIPIFFVRQFVLHPFYNPTAGMAPTLMGETKTPDGHLKRGDSFMVDKFTYHFNQPRRGDLLVFKTKDLHFPGIPPNQIFVKRLAGLPGERVSIHPPYVLINGTKLVTPAVFERISSQPIGYLAAGRLDSEGKEIALGNDEYFVLGDNTQNSLDGRYFGPVKRSNVLGKVAWIYAPTDRKGRPQ